MVYNDITFNKINYFLNYLNKIFVNQLIINVLFNQQQLMMIIKYMILVLFIKKIIIKYNI